MRDSAADHVQLREQRVALQDKQQEAKERCDAYAGPQPAGRKDGLDERRRKSQHVQQLSPHAGYNDPALCSSGADRVDRQDGEHEGLRSDRYRLWQDGQPKHRVQRRVGSMRSTACLP